MFRAIVCYGADETVLESPEPITVGQIRRDARVKMELGYGDNVRIKLKGIEQPDEAIIPQDARVQVETAANKKAA